MIVCYVCKTEIECFKNGIGVRFGENHVYMGDLFKCKTCKTKIILTVSKSTFDLEKKLKTIQMKEE